MKFTAQIRSFFLHPFWGALIFLAGIYAFKQGKLNKPEVTYLNPPPEYIEYFHFGFRESMADSFWLRWIQDNDTCQTYLSPTLYNLEPLEKGTPKDSLLWNPRHKACENSWSFKMLDAVTKLAPKFEMPYVAGASTLAILVEDFAGASVIYERGMREYPENWQLLYRAAFHYQFNLRDVEKAAALLIRVADLGGPVWTRSLAARLYTVGGQIELSIGVLEQYRKSIDPENKEAIMQVDSRLRELRDKLRVLTE